MLLIQIVAATLLLLGSSLILRALVELDRADTPPPTLRRVARPELAVREPDREESLRRAA